MKTEHSLEFIKLIQNEELFVYKKGTLFSWKTLTFAIVMEYAEGGSLIEHLRDCGPFEEKLAKTYSKQLLEALTELH